VAKLDNEKARCKTILAQAGCSEQVAEEIWKWYDSKDKKGVASF
jgi:hypothetical protein